MRQPTIVTSYKPRLLEPTPDGRARIELSPARQQLLILNSADQADELIRVLTDARYQLILGVTP